MERVRALLILLHYTSDITYCSKRCLCSYPLPGLVIERPRHVDGPRHVLDGEGAAKVAAGDLVADAGG